MRIKKICRCCKSVFTRRHNLSNLQWTIQIYCSMKCFYKARKVRIQKSCAFCNAKILVAPALIRIGSGKFCDAECYAKWQSENRRLENSYSWTGGSEKTYRDIAKKVVLKKSIPLVCSKCGRQESIIIHHKDLNIKNNKISNLKVLCQSCHVNLHYKIAGTTKADRARYFVCCICHKRFAVNVKGDRKVCSSKCSNEYCKRGLHWRNREN